MDNFGVISFACGIRNPEFPCHNKIVVHGRLSFVKKLAQLGSEFMEFSAFSSNFNSDSSVSSSPT